jgi:cytochrome c
MSSLETNKILAAILVAGLLAMGTSKVADGLRHPAEMEENAFKILVPESDQQQAAPAGPAPVEPILALLASADVGAGESLAKKCSACHSVDEGGGNKVGPALWDVVNRGLGAVDGFKYSDALMSHEQADSWTYTALNGFLHKPKEWAPGTKMNYAGLKKVEDRANLIAYLRALSGSPAALPTPEEIEAANAAYQAASGG